MGKLCIILLLVCFSSVFAQSANPKISNELPQIVPASPSVSSLMKFEEVPVTGYTGTPDISIPLYKLSTHSKDIELDISLKYHPANVKADNVAGDVGLGWSVFAGGTVSRVVRGLPDEELVMAGTNQSGKVGIYHTTINNHNNIYYQWIQNPVNFEQNNPNIANEYYWETVENGKYDTEHDLWQFNFMGNTGSFYLKKIDNQLIVEPLNDYRLHIQTNFETYYNQPYTPKGFTIFDEKGYKYIFDVYETTVKSTDGLHHTFQNNNHSSFTTHSDEKEFRSSFHLTKVIDSNNKTVFDILYDDTVFKENNLQYNKTRNEYDDATMNAMKYANCWGEIPPMESTVISNNIVTTKKIKTITVADKAIIDFTYLKGRDDYSTNSNTPFLKEVKLKNINQSLVSKFTLDYDYNQIIVKRLFLKSIVKSYPNQSVTEKHEFYYRRNSPFGNPSVFGRDFWGYFNTYNSDNCNAQDITYVREASPKVSTYDLLQRIKYPTTGSAVFLFETNQYSFTGNEAINDFAENPDSTSFIETTPYYFTNSSSTHNIPVSTEKRKIIVYPSIVLDNDPNNWTRTFHISKIVNGQNIPIGSIHCVLPEANCCKEFILEPNTQYVLKRHNFDLNYIDTDNMTVNFYGFNQNNKFLYGGGNRIKKIGYFNGEIPQDYYEYPNQNINPNKEKIYNYNLHSDLSKSSGSLVFGKPKFEEIKFVKQVGTSCANAQSFDGLYSYLSRFIISNQEQVFTQGSSIGYKNVKITETGLGSIEQVFTSPIDYPETQLITYTKPYLPSKNIDYKRGLLLEARIKNETGVPLIETQYTYSFDNFEKTYGYRFNRPDGMLFQGRLKSQHNFQSYLAAQQMAQTFIMHCDIPTNTFLPLCDFFSKSHLLGNSPIHDIDYYPLLSAYGWAKLASKQTKNYFYENGNQKILEKNESFEYNPLNKKLSQQITTTEDGTELKTKYFYHSGNSSYSQNRISEIEKIESYQNGKLLDTRKINYNNSWMGNVSFLPNQVQSSLGSGALETELTYDQYDDKGNVVQYTSKDGIPTTIVWGYNKTQPIAKIVGIDSDAVSGSLISSIVNASNTDASDPSTEPALITALDSFRKNSSLAGYQVTTYTYDPLIGVTSITPPSGIREVYIYDNANRLKEIRENNAAGKLIKEFKYNYKQ